MKPILILFFIRFFSYFPLWLLQAISYIVACIIYYVPNKQKKITTINIKTFFPYLSKKGREKFLKKTLVENCCFLAETVKLTTMCPKKTRGLIKEKENGDLLSKKASLGKGVIVAAPHLGNWEVGLYTLTGVRPITVMYAPSKKPYLDKLIKTTREKTTATLVPANTSGIRQLLKALKKGDIVAILPDQRPKEGQASIYAPFMGVHVQTMLLIQTLSKRTGAEVIYGYCKRNGIGKGFNQRLIEASDLVKSLNAKDAATYLNKGVYECVREAPEQYQWTYKRLDVSFYDKILQNKQKL